MGSYKRQHTITESYLRGFTDESAPNSLWRYNKEDGGCEICSVAKATVKFHAYSFREPNGKWNHTVEHLLGDIESVAVPILSKIKQGKEISLTERYDFALFVGTIIRRPAAQLDIFRDAIRKYGNDRDAQISFIDQNLPRLLERYTAEEIEQEQIRINEGTSKVSFDVAKKAALRTWVEAMPTYCQIIANMHWQIVKAEGGYFFLTSDAPAFVRRETRDDDLGIVGIGRADLKAELVFPLSQKLLLIAKHVACRPMQIAKKSRVKELNRLIVRMAHSHLFTHAKSESVRALVACNKDFAAPLPDLSMALRDDD